MPDSVSKGSMGQRLAEDGEVDLSRIKPDLERQGLDSNSTL